MGKLHSIRCQPLIRRRGQKSQNPPKNSRNIKLFDKFDNSYDRAGPKLYENVEYMVSMDYIGMVFKIDQVMQLLGVLPNLGLHLIRQNSSGAAHGDRPPPQGGGSGSKTT